MGPILSLPDPLAPTWQLPGGTMCPAWGGFPRWSLAQADSGLAGGCLGDGVTWGCTFVADAWQLQDTN